MPDKQMFQLFKRMNIFPTIAGLLVSLSINAQSYNIGHSYVVLTDQLRGGRKVPVDIYYPVGQQNDNLNERQKNETRFPVVCFAHGYLMSSSAYTNIQEMLVPEGIIMIFPRTCKGLFPSHRRYAEDIAFVLNETLRLSNDSSSVLYGITGANRCLMGHSMGGGALFQAANMVSDLFAVAALSPLNARPSTLQAASLTEVPVLLITGSNDCITSLAEHQQPLYESSASGDKTSIVITGGNHCQMGSENTLCKLGEKMKGCKAGISRDEQHKILGRYLIPWLRFYLKGDVAAGALFNSTLSSDKAVVYQHYHKPGHKVN